MASTPAPACSSLPLILVKTVAFKARLALLTAIRPAVLSRLLVLMTVSPLPVCTISPLALFRFARFSGNWPPTNWPWVLTRDWPLLALAVIASKLLAEMTALFVLTSPVLAVIAILAAPVWLPDRSIDAPLKTALPAARFWPLANKTPSALMLRSPIVPRLPSAFTPAPSKPLLVTLPALIVVLLAETIVPVLFRSPRILAVKFVPALSVPCWFSKLAASRLKAPVPVCSTP